MIGFRGASRYYDDRYRDGFALECRALRRVREAESRSEQAKARRTKVEATRLDKKMRGSLHEPQKGANKK